MFSNLTDKEAKAASQLIGVGVEKAAKALESILNTPVSVTSVEYGNDDLEQVPAYSTKQMDKKTHLLKTELVGELKGFCHLIFSEEEVMSIQNHCLPDEILHNNTAQNRLMKLEHMTEIDNMVAGAVITEFANYLDVEVYGNVPSLHIMHAEEVNKYIHAEAVVYNSGIYFIAALEAPDLGVKSDFVWLFQESFIDQLKGFAESDRATQLA